MSFPEKETPDNRVRIFPKLESADLKDAFGKVSFDKGAWRLYGPVMAAENGDPSLYELLEDFAGFFKFYRSTRIGFLDGAAGFYMVLDVLARSGKGYVFPVVSSGTADSYVNAVSLAIESQYPVDPIAKRKDVGRKVEETGTSLEVNFIEETDVYEENPDLMPWFMKMSPIMRLGALQVYRLKRRQMEVDLVRKLSGLFDDIIDS
jgi:hypothetical protein